MAQELLTPRLRLRSWRAADLPIFAALNADPRVREHLPSLLTRAESDAMAERIRAHTQLHGFGLWAIEVVGGAAFIGYAGLMRPTFEAPFMPCVEISWRLAHEHWGHGFATEAARAVLEDGFGRLGFEEIVSFTVPANVRSLAVMERLGMRRDLHGDFEHPHLPAGHRLRKHVLYRLARADFAG